MGETYEAEVIREEVEEKAVVLASGTGALMEKSAMRPEDVLGQVQLIQCVMKQAMKEGEHFGVIPGTDKPSLLQPGADKLLLTFRLGPDFKILDSIREKDFISYTIRCDLVHIPSGNKVGSGMGSCNSREAKYRWKSKNTGRPVPSDYWQTRAARLLGGSQFKPRKVSGQWVIFEMIENDNPWDFDNTLLKMACKRAKVAAALNATAAHDIFTQDVEDMKPASSPAQPSRPAQSAPPRQQNTRQAPQGGAQGSPAMATDNQKKAIYAMSKKAGIDQLQVVGQVLGRPMANLDQLTKAEASRIIDHLNGGQNGR